VGFLGGEFGLAVAARNSARALSASGRVVEPVVLEHRAGRTSPGPEPALPSGGEAGDRRLTLFHANPLDVAVYAGQWRSAVDPAWFRCCVPFWEMPLVPRSWAPVLRAMDAVLAPTRFVQRACAAVLPEDRVLHYPQAVFLPDAAQGDRTAFGIPADATVFAVSFDAGSDSERKNPMAAVEAFQRAFPSDRGVALLVKMRPWPDLPGYRAEAQRLRDRLRADGRIRVVEAALPYPEVLRLYASSDVLVSLHRSEGLGLHLMEAMSLGKVVVATGWSGNVDFMTEENSVLVGYRLVPVAPRHPHYLAEVGRPGQVWAEPDVDQAAAALRALHEDPGRRLRLGAAAARDMERRRVDACSGAPFSALEALADVRAARPRRLRGAVWATLARAAWAGARAKWRRGGP
jgi:glycosyltransferase involved in cell wall biosynthesis